MPPSPMKPPHTIFLSSAGENGAMIEPRACEVLGEIWPSEDARAGLAVRLRNPLDGEWTKSLSMYSKSTLLLFSYSHTNIAEVFNQPICVHVYAILNSEIISRKVFVGDDVILLFRATAFPSEELALKYARPGIWPCLPTPADLSRWQAIPGVWGRVCRTWHTLRVLVLVKWYNFVSSRS